MQLLQGDCLELMKNIPDKSVDMVLCDPPYGIGYQSARKPKEQRFSKIINDEKPFVNFIEQLPRIIKPNGGGIYFHKMERSTTVYRRNDSAWIEAAKCSYLG